MKTFVQMLRIAFWMLPIQRWLTSMGLLVVVLALRFGDRLDMPGGNLPIVFLGVALMVFTPAVAGGVFLRMISAPKAVGLLPRARGRLLAGALSVAIVAVLLWTGSYVAVMSFGPLPRGASRPESWQYALLFVLSLSFATQCVIFQFIAARGPVWLLAALGLWTAPSVAVRLLDLQDASRLVAGPVMLAGIAAAWLLFGAWFLRVRTIGASAWLAGGAVSGFSLTARAPRAMYTPATREQAMERAVLGLGSFFTIGGAWLLCAGALVGVQLLLARQHELKPIFVAVLFVTLSCAGLAALGPIGYLISARSRGLWLVGERSRAELHAWCERRLLRASAAILVPFVALTALLWLTLTPRPVLPPAYLLAAMIAPGVVAACFGLVQVGRLNVAVEILCGALVLAGWFFGLAQPLFGRATEAPWRFVVAQLALAAVLREVARRRWLAVDWPRAQHPALVR